MMPENAIHIKIPLQRVGALIGPSGTTKKIIENRLNVVLDIDGESGSVWITPQNQNTDPVTLFRTRDIVLAIGRGFAPENAFRLFHDEIYLNVIDLRDVFGKSESDISRVKSRVIGKKGRTRQQIEELSGSVLSIYGHTIMIIGKQSQVNVAREAIQRFIRGDQHKSVYDFLQRKRRELKFEETKLWQETKY
jgi:ribosomal RNA assembly protein